MTKAIEAKCKDHLRAVGEVLSKHGLDYRFEKTPREGSLHTLTVMDAEGAEDVTFDIMNSLIGDTEYVMISLRCLLIPGLVDELLPDLNDWSQYANITMPLGSIVLLDDELILKYNVMSKLDKLLDESFLDTMVRIFFLERLLYSGISVDLALGDITLEEAVGRLIENDEEEEPEE